MNDNIDKPPERLFVFFNHVDEKGNTLYTAGDIKMKGDIEYIRADVARKREEKLIVAGHHAWVHLITPHDFAHATNVLYKIAGLEALE